jgi:hypothetical protein
MIFVTETKCVFCDVRPGTGYLNIIVEQNDVTSALRIHFVHLLQVIRTRVLMAVRTQNVVCSLALRGADQDAQTLKPDVTSLFNSRPRNSFF